MATEDLEIYSRFNPYLETFVEVRLVNGVVRSLSFPDEPHPEAEEEHAVLDRIEDYLSGTVKDDFIDIEIDLAGAEPDRAVLEALRKIPYGENASVEDIIREVPALKLQRSEDHDRVREILDSNPVPLLLPDHRVRDGPSAAPPNIEQRLRSLEQIIT